MTLFEALQQFLTSSFPVSHAQESEEGRKQSLQSLYAFGYQFHDQELVVLRILNWPSAL